MTIQWILFELLLQLDPNAFLGGSHSLCSPAAAVPVGVLCAHLNASADVIHDLDCPAVPVAREGLGESGDLHLPFGLSTSFLSIDGFTRRALQTPVLQGERSRYQSSTPTSHGHGGPVGTGQRGTLLPLEYMASMQSMWKECWQFVRRPTVSGLMALPSHVSL